MNKDRTCAICAIGLVVIIVLGFGMSMTLFGFRFGINSDIPTTTTTTTTTVPTTTEPTTTEPTTTTEPDKYYTIKMMWSLDAPEISPAWVLVDYFTLDDEYQDGRYMFYEDTWYDGQALTEILEGTQGYLTLSSSTGWAFEAGVSQFVSAGPWSNSWEIWSGGAHNVPIGQLMFTWVEV
jgi:hypothetical protein